MGIERTSFNLRRIQTTTNLVIFTDPGKINRIIGINGVWSSGIRTGSRWIANFNSWIDGKGDLARDRTPLLAGGDVGGTFTWITRNNNSRLRIRVVIQD